MDGPGSVLDPVLFHGGLAIAKAGLVALGALGFSLFLRNGPAAARHALWTTTLVVLLFIPVLSFFPGSLPSIPVSTLGTVQGSSLETTFLREGSDPPRSISATRIEVPGPVRDRVEDPSHTDWTVAPSTASETRGLEASTSPERNPGLTPSGSRRMWPLAFWLLGMSGFLLPLLAGLVRGRRMIVQSLPLDTPCWTAAIERAKRRVGLRRSVATLLSPEASTAMAGGIVRPVVVLPGDAPAWGSERRELVLLHELVHVKRSDPARQLLGRIVLALYWFHPLVWMAVRKAGAAREEACDERVIELGQRPSVYARHLLELTSSPSRPLAGMTGFHHPDLESRLMAILKPRARTRRPFAAFAVVTLGLVWMGLVATLGPASAESPAGDTPAPGIEAIPALVMDQEEPGRWVLAADTIAPPAPQPPPAPDPAPPAAPTVSPPPSPDSPARVAPPAPPAPPSSCDRTDDRFGSGWYQAQDGVISLVRLSLDDLTLCLRTEGDVRWSDDRTRIQSIPEGAAVEIVLTTAEGTHRFEVTPGPAGLQTRWHLNDEEGEVDADVLELRDSLIAYLGTYSEQAELRGREARLRGEIARIRGEGARLQGEVARVRGHDARLRGEVARTRGEGARLQGEIARLQGEEARMRGEIALIRGSDARLKGERAMIAMEIRSLERARDRVGDGAAREELDAAILELKRETDRIATSLESSDMSDRIAEIEARLEEHRAHARVRTAELRSEIDALRVGDEVEIMQREIAAYREESEGVLEDLQARIEEHRAGAESRIGELEEAIADLDMPSALEVIEFRMEAAEARLRDAVRRAGAR